MIDPIPPVDVLDLPLYVSSDGRSVTDWYGNFVGTVVDASRVRLAQWSYIHGKDITAYRVVINGRPFYGRSSRGMYINLRPYKSKK